MLCRLFHGGRLPGQGLHVNMETALAPQHHGQLAVAADPMAGAAAALGALVELVFVIGHGDPLLLLRKPRVDHQNAAITWRFSETFAVRRA
jgi:hypothetical protein